jgi:hypothetical protein
MWGRSNLTQTRKWLTREMLNCFSTVLKLSKKKIRRKIVKLNQLLESNLDLYPCKECMNVRLNLSHRENWSRLLWSHLKIERLKNMTVKCKLSEKMCVRIINFSKQKLLMKLTPPLQVVCWWINPDLNKTKQVGIGLRVRYRQLE